MRKILVLFLVFSAFWGGKDCDAQYGSYPLVADSLWLVTVDRDTVGLFDFKNERFGISTNNPGVDVEIAESDLIGNAQLRLTTPSGGADPSIQFRTGDEDWTISVDNSDSDKWILSNSLNPQTTPIITATAATGQIDVTGTLPNVRVNGSSGSARIGIDASDFGFLNLFNSSGVSTHKLTTGGDDSYINAPLAIGKTSISSSATLDVDGYVKRYDVVDWDAIAWFPPADSGAVTDTTSNSWEELDFYSTTDSTVATNTWHTPSTFSSLDSMKIYFGSPTSESPDSTCWGVRIRATAVGETRAVSMTEVGRDTVEVVNTVSAVNEATITGFSGISANDIVDFELFFDNTIANVVNGPTPLYRTRIYYK